MLVNLTAGDVVQLDNSGSTGPLFLQPNNGGTLQAVNASVLIQRIN